MDQAPSVLAPHISALLSSNVSAAAIELQGELAAANLLSDEGQASIEGATDYIISFLEEFTSQSFALLSAHQNLLRTIVEGAKDGNLSPTDFDTLMFQSRPRLDSGFLCHLRDERTRMENLGDGTLAAFLVSIEQRVREELESMSREDADAFAALLNEGNQALAVTKFVAAKDDDGLRRFWGWCQVLAGEQESKGSTQIPEIPSLLETIGAAIRSRLE